MLIWLISALWSSFVACSGKRRHVYNVTRKGTFQYLGAVSVVHCSNKTSLDWDELFPMGTALIEREAQEVSSYGVVPPDGIERFQADKTVTLYTTNRFFNIGKRVFIAARGKPYCVGT